jgi:uncharacterized protein
MRKKRRIIPMLVMMLLIMYLSGVNAFAVSPKVYDKAELFSEMQREELEKNTSDMSERLKLDIVIVTTNSNEGKTSRAYADDFFDQNGFGYGGSEDGLLLLINMEDREVYISTCGKAIQYFTDERINSTLDKVYTYLTDGNYSEGAAAFLKEVEYYVQQGIPSNQYKQDESTGRIYDRYSEKPVNKKADLGKLILICFGIAFAAGGITVGVMAMNNRGTLSINQDTYLDKNSFNIVSSEDRHYDTRVTHVTISNNSSNSGKSTTHSSSSGRSHGGGGRKF